MLSVVAQVGLGGMISEKMMNRAGVADSSLLLGRTGTNTELSVLGFAPTISTLPATAIGGGVTSATLNGRVTDMNGMPSATGYFQWGYAVGALTNTTATIPITVAGDYSKVASGFTANPVYYRFVVDADGTAYGATTQFSTPVATGTAMLRNLLRVCVAIAILVGVVRESKRGLGAMLLTVMVGLVAFILISMFIDAAL